MVFGAALLLLGLASGQEVTVEEAEESYDYYYYQQNEEDFENVFHPSHSYLYDVPGYPDLSCASDLHIKVLSAKFGYSKPSFAEASHPCVFDFTPQYLAGQCSTSRCTSPELSKLGLSSAVSCPSGGGLGMWEVYYVCEAGTSTALVSAADDYMGGSETDVSDVMEVE